MKTLADLQTKITNFWSIDSEEERDQIVEQIRAYANSTAPTTFAKEVKNMLPQESLSGIGVIYEALSTNPDKWGDFFLEEYQRAFKSAEQSDNAFAILDSLEQIGFVEASSLPFTKQIIDLLRSYLDHPKDVLRYKAIWLIGDWIDEENYRDYPQIVRNVKGKLQDSNWKIRHIVTYPLETWKQLPNGYQPSWLDRMRRKFYNPFEI